MSKTHEETFHQRGYRDDKSERCKLKPQWDIITYQSGCLKWKIVTIKC